MAIVAGQLAPDFTLFNTQKNAVTLSSFRGQPVVLLFFPLAFTSVCTKELCSVRDAFQEYNEVNAAVFGISVDSLYTLARFRAEQHLNFELLSDFNRVVSAAYDCLYPEFTYGMNGVSKRAAFVIDGAGKVQYAEVLQNAGDLPEFSTIREKLRELR